MYRIQDENSRQKQKKGGGFPLGWFSSEFSRTSWLISFQVTTHTRKGCFVHTAVERLDTRADRFHTWLNHESFGRKDGSVPLADWLVPRTHRLCWLCDWLQKKKNVGCSLSCALIGSTNRPAHLVDRRYRLQAPHAPLAPRIGHNDRFIPLAESSSSPTRPTTATPYLSHHPNTRCQLRLSTRATATLANPPPLPRKQLLRPGVGLQRGRLFPFCVVTPAEVRPVRPRGGTAADGLPTKRRQGYISPGGVEGGGELTLKRMR